MRELGIQPSVITGTSVGGLNAALIAQGDQRTARELWGSIASRQVFRWRRLASPLVLILRLGFIAGSPKVAGGRRRWETLEPVLEASSLTYLLMMTLVGLFSLPDWARAPWNLHLSPAQGVWAYALMVAWNVVTVVLLDALVVTPPIIWHLLERRDLFVLDNGPLKQTLAEHLDAATVARAPQLVLVTSASQVEYFDPDRPELVRVGGRSGAPHYRPAFETRFHPHYATLNAKTEAEIEDLLVRTSSLPFGIFPRATRLEGGCRGTLDGGVADNTPLLPMLRLGLERIVIIHLRRPGGRRRTSPRRRLSVLAALDAAVVQAALDLERLTRRAPESEAAYRSFVAEHGQLLSYFEWLRLPVGRRAERPVWALPELIHIVPSKRLGGLLTGTLRFSGRKSRKLMRLGYADTLQAFREQG